MADLILLLFIQQHYKEKHVYNDQNRNINDITNYEKITAFKQQKQVIKSDQVIINDSKPIGNKIVIVDASVEQSIVSATLDNDTTTTSSSNNEENEKSTIRSDEIYISNINKSESKMQKNELIRGLLDRKHQCKWCAQRFYTKSQLRQHESTHTNTVLYCPVCDKEFTHKDRLTGHMKCHMEPSLECKVCGKKFKRLCNLYNHELVHGLTEHAFMLCQFCGRGFRSRRDYQNHVIANHRDQLMKSEIIKNSNSGSILNDSYNNMSGSTSILSEELQKGSSEKLLRNGGASSSNSNSENLSDFFSPLKHRNNSNNDSNFENIEEGIEKINTKRSKQNNNVGNKS